MRSLAVWLVEMSWWEATKKSLKAPKRKTRGGLVAMRLQKDFVLY
jgi:hypothetical protein